MAYRVPGRFAGEWRGDMSRKPEIEEQLAFLGLTDDDVSELQGLRPLLEEHAEAFVKAFYRHLLSFEPTRRLLVDPSVKEGLLRKQRDYLLSLASDPLDEVYMEERRQIGETHARLGIRPRWYLGAYSTYVSSLVPLICANHVGEPARTERRVLALVKRLLLDAQVAMEAYMEAQGRQLDHLNRELASMGRELERMYAEQTSQLRETTRRAQAAEELASVATLVSGLAHEIGTPMNVIQGHTELLEASLGDEDARRRLGTIQEQVDRISHIIQTLLSIARPREPVRAPVELGAVIDATLEFTAEKLRRRKVRVERDYGPVPAVRGDREKLQQLFLNLILNAADAMPQGGTLRVALRSIDGDQIEVRIVDTGIGIESERLRQIFEPFHSTKPAGSGSGLGLTVARGIVSDHAGTIDVESTPGVRTEFRIVLPLGEGG